VKYAATTDGTCGVINDAALTQLPETQSQLAAQEIARQNGVPELSAETQDRRTTEAKTCVLNGSRRAFRLQ
jgi:hypothetical protein